MNIQIQVELQQQQPASAPTTPARRKRSDTNPLYGKGPTLMEQRDFLLGINRAEYMKKYCK